MEVAHALTGSKTATGRLDPNGEDFVVAGTITEHFPGESNRWAPFNEADNLVAGTLPADYHKQGGNGMGEMEGGIIPFDARNGVETGEIASSLQANAGAHNSLNAQPLIAFSAGQSSKAGGIAADEHVAPPIRSANSGSNQVPTIAYTIQQNDGGEHKRKDRPNGGLYVQETDTALTVGSTDLTAVVEEVAKPLAFENTNDHQDESQQTYVFDWQSGGQTRLNMQEKPNLTAGQTPAVWEMSHADEGVREGGDVSPTLQQRMGTGGNQVPLVGVRRLTAVECSRLQGFPDDWNEWGVDKDGKRVVMSDSARYKQLGNAVAVPVIEWIGKRIVQADVG